MPATQGLQYVHPGKRKAGSCRGCRAQGSQQPSLGRHEPFQVPGQRLGQGQQPQRLRGRCTVYDHQIPRAGLDLGPKLEQSHDLIGPGELGQLVRYHRVDPESLEHGQEIVLHRAPGAPDTMGRAELQGAKTRFDLDHRVGIIGRSCQVDTQGVAE